MADFPHLNLKKKLDGRYQFAGRRIEKVVDPQTDANLADRPSHATKLTAASGAVLQDYNAFLAQRTEEGLPDLFDKNAVPLFLQVDPKDFDIESLKGFGIEIISEEDDGFIIGANTDNFASLATKIDNFIQNTGKSKDQAAKLWQIVQGTQWRVDYILSESLREKYIAGIQDTEEFWVDISVACYLKLPDRPVRCEQETDEEYAAAKAKHEQKNYNDPHRKMRKQRQAETDEAYEKRLERWRRSSDEVDMARDEIASQRQDFLTNFIVTTYGGELLSSFIDLQDSFGFRARMSGQALKDLIRGYPYVFEISEADQVDADETVQVAEQFRELTLIPPEQNAEIIGVIDSGMQEGHVLLAPAILTNLSRNYVPNENTTSDQVADGGHGTKVAGAILYGNNIPAAGSYQLPCFLANIRVLDSSNNLPSMLYPPQLMEQIIDDFPSIRIFNMSVASRGPCRNIHMSTWAAAIDKLIHEKQKLFLLAAGNIKSSTGQATRPGIAEHLRAGRAYPSYLLEASSRLSNPAQSLLALTVGSVCPGEFEDADRLSFGKKNEISSFSRTGPGMWGCIKPDVVEYGGDFLRERNGYLITQHNDVSTAIVKTGTNGIGWAIGTSFATPKVGHILALLASKFRSDSTLLYKALIIQSARLPEHIFFHPTAEALRYLGYGVPDIQRAMENTPYRVTFVAEGTVAAQQANLYSINLPEELMRQGTDLEVLIEVTLTFTAMPRRTRKRLKSYFGSWLTWESSKLGESFDDFSTRVLQQLAEPEETHNNDEILADTKSIRWTVSTNPTYGLINEFKRQDSASQKDWVILKSNQLTPELSFAVVGHKGWDKDTVQQIPFALAISLELTHKEIPIYTQIEALNQVEIEQPIEVLIPV